MWISHKIWVQRRNWQWWGKTFIVCSRVGDPEHPHSLVKICTIPFYRWEKWSPEKWGICPGIFPLLTAEGFDKLKICPALLCHSPISCLQILLDQHFWVASVPPESPCSSTSPECQAWSKDLGFGTSGHLMCCISPTPTLPETPKGLVCLWLGGAEWGCVSHLD